VKSVTIGNKNKTSGPEKSEEVCLFFVKNILHISNSFT